MSLIIMEIAETHNYSVTPYEILCLNIAEILRVYILFKSLCCVRLSESNWKLVLLKLLRWRISH